MATKVVRIEGDLQAPIEKNLSWVQGDSITIEAIVNDNGRLFKNADTAYTQLKFYVDDNVATAAFNADTGQITLPSGIAAKYAASGFDYELRLEGAGESVTIAKGKVMASRSYSVVGTGDVIESKLHVLAQDDLTALAQHAGALGNYIATSTTSQAIVGSGQFALTVEAGRDFQVDDEVTVLYTDDPAIFMMADVVSYSGTTLTLDGQSSAGTGTYAKWSIFKRFTAGGAGSGPTINDAGTASNEVWSSTKVSTELTSKEGALQSDAGTKVVLADDAGNVTYAAQDAVGPQINDAGTETDETWSASKVSTELATKLPLAAVPTGGTTGQILAKASATDRDTEWVDQSGGGSGVNASALTDTRIGVGDGSEVIGHADFLWDDAGKTITFGTATMKQAAAEIEFLLGGSWAILEGQSFKLKNGGGVTYDGTHNISLNATAAQTTTGWTFNSSRHRFAGGHVHIPLLSSAPADGDINNNEMVPWRDTNDIKVRVKDGAGALGTATIGTVTWD